MNPNDDDAALNGEDTRWLHQFYTPSKTTQQTEFADGAEGGGGDAPEDALLQQQQPPAATLSTLPGEKYEVADELGTGGMKLVRRTRDRNAARDVALAVLLDPSPRAKKVSRFVREARITAALEHPNIVPIYDIGVHEDGKPYFTMKLLEGETLHGILQKLNEGDADYRRRFPLVRLLQIFLGVCNAVGFAHSRGVIHLDLKPANIQVGAFGEVLVLDWGLAKVLEKDPALYPNRLVLGEGLREMPSEGVVRGTPGFMGPEQSRGEYASLNELTDIFALGSVLYTILKCKVPSRKVDEGRKVAPAFKIPPALEAVATKAMARQPGNRYQSVKELAGDVQAFLDGHATKAQQAGALTLLWLLIKRHNVVTSLICASLLAIVGTFTVALVRVRHSEMVAVDALRRMSEDQENRRKLSLLAAPRVLQDAEFFLHMYDYDQALSKLDYAVALDSDYTQAWWELGALHLGRQEFEQANLAFAHVVKQADNNAKSGAVNDLPLVAKKYAALARETRGAALRDRQEEFVYDLLKADRTAWQFRQIALGAYFKMQNRSVETANFDLIEKALRYLNPDVKSLVFQHEETEDGLKVKVGGERLTQPLPLVGLPITSLDLSGIPSVDLLWVRDMPLVSVDLSRSRTVDLLPLSKIPTLSELRLVNARDKDFARLRSMSQLKRIVVGPAEVTETRKALESRGKRTSPTVSAE